MKNSRRLLIPLSVIVILAVFSIWYFLSRNEQVRNSSLKASGTIEAEQVIVAPETGGLIIEVLVQEGESVRAGQVLARFDDSLLQAQLAQTKATLVVAQANYDLVAAGLTAEQRQVAITSAQLELLAAQQALKSLYENADLLGSRALQDIAAANEAIDAAEKKRNNLISGSTQADIDAAKAVVTLAKDQLERAEENFAKVAKKPEDNLRRAVLLSKKAEAQIAYDAAVTRLNNLLARANEIDLALIESDLTFAKAQLADAQQRYEILKNGPDPDDVALAEAKIASAEAHLATANAGPSPEQLEVAQTQVDAAQSALKVINAQLDKLVLKTPVDGVVLSRSVEAGEVVSPGAPILTIGRLDELMIIVFVPEDRYGTINLGDHAQVQVDSFPGQIFTATVIRIAERAEFTPRNVQTEEGRRTTVFAVELSVSDPNRNLKPGMPADVTFEE